MLKWYFLWAYYEANAVDKTARLFKIKLKPNLGKLYSLMLILVCHGKISVLFPYTTYIYLSCCT